MDDRKPDSVTRRLRTTRQSFLSPACAGRRPPQPKPARAVRLLPGERFAEAKPARRQLPCFVLHRGRFLLPRLLPVGRWALTPPFHPYRKRHEAPPGGLFSVILSVMPCFRVAFPQILCGPLSSGVRTFLPQAKLRATAGRPQRLVGECARVVQIENVQRPTSNDASVGHSTLGVGR